MTKDEALKLALEALETCEWVDDGGDGHAEYDPVKVIGAINTLREALTEQPAQQQEPVAYDKTELNCFAQDLYDQKMREGKRGHYESMFHVIHQCIKKFAPQPSKPWVGLTQQEQASVLASVPTVPFEGDWHLALLTAIEAKLKEKNGGGV